MPKPLGRRRMHRPGEHRNAQVQTMGRIYLHARKVLIWLGDGVPGVDPLPLFKWMAKESSGLTGWMRYGAKGDRDLETLPKKQLRALKEYRGVCVCRLRRLLLSCSPKDRQLFRFDSVPC